MASDQQFCLRWNNHQSTLTSIFDLLLEEESLLDCTLAAEGQSLQAHRILLSACSPYFQSLLNQHAKKEPIIVLKDVTFKELRALMDYMYKGEVNVSQDELGELLKVAESLQIKGLSDSGPKTTEDRQVQQRLAPPPPPPPAQQTPTVPRSGLSIEHRRSNYHANNDLRNDSPSAIDESSFPRKRKRQRRRSSEEESGLVHGQPSAEPLQELESLSLPSSLVIKPSITHAPTPPVPSNNATVIPETIAALDRPPDHILPEPTALTLPTPKTEPGLMQPKQENEDQNEEEDIEDLTMDDDYMDDSQPGPSHGSEGSTSNQGYPQWQMGADGSFDEDLLRAQAAAGGSRDSQDSIAEWLPGASDRAPRIHCPTCNKSFKIQATLKYHRKHECGKILQCPMCQKTFIRNHNLVTHVRYECGRDLRCLKCNKKFSHKANLYRHNKYECVQ